MPTNTTQIAASVDMSAGAATPMSAANTMPIPSVPRAEANRMHRWNRYAFVVLLGCGADHSAPPQVGGCDPTLSLPAGFCAEVFADNLGAIRHLAVTSDGTAFVARWAASNLPGGLLMVRDTNHDGRADQVRVLANSGGSGLAVTTDAVYMSTWTAVLRYPLHANSIDPETVPESILVGLPESGHAARSIVVDSAGRLYVNIGAPTNSCQVADKALHSRGRDPCPELQQFAGIWSFDARKARQQQVQGQRVVTGIRHMVALTRHPTNGSLYGVQHGRDDLHEAFPNLYTRDAAEQTPAEELFRLTPSSDYGWPYCYYDAERREKVLAPEYGGDGEATGRCVTAQHPLFAFPAHWAPNGLLFYSGNMFPSRYRGGAFVAFHGAWYRRPPDNGFNVVFLPFQGDTPASQFELFAEGFAGANRRPDRAAHRPVGLAQGPEGELFISDDVRGRIWRVRYRAASS